MRVGPAAEVEDHPGNERGAKADEDEEGLVDRRGLDPGKGQGMRPMLEQVESPHVRFLG